jgi:phosphatidylinositol alpha-1,6-mannosyltransferase
VFRAKIANQLRSLGVPAERLCLLPMPIRAWRAVPGRAESRSRLGLPQDSPVILCVSQFTLRKHEDDPIPGKTEALVDLLDAFAALPSDTLLVLVGDGKGRKELESRVSRLKIEGRVRFVGEVEHDDLCWFYAACNFFAFPDVFDMPRLAILEAQACGRPVVTMQTDSAQLTVDAGRTGLLARNLEEFQVHLRALVRDKDRCEEMGRAGPEYIAGFHSIEAFASQIEELLIGRCGAVESKLGHTGTPN